MLFPVSGGIDRKKVDLKKFSLNFFYEYSFLFGLTRTDPRWVVVADRSLIFDNCEEAFNELHSRQSM